MKKIFPTLLLSASLVACSDSSTTQEDPVDIADDQPASTDSEAITQLEADGTIPVLQRDDTMSGIDADSNGVRDDIDQYIQDTHEGGLQLAAATQSARAMQGALAVDLADTNSIKAVQREISRSVNCVYETFSDVNGVQSPARVVKDIESLTTNTKPRLTAYLKYSRALDGKTWSIPEGETCE